MNLHGLPLSPERQAHLYATGMLTILTLGTLASIAAVVAALWLLVQVVILCLESTIEALTTVGATYQAADPLVRFLILLTIGAVLYRAGRFMLRRTHP